MRVGDVVVAHGVAKRDDVESAAADAKRQGRRIGDVLVERRLLDERELYRALAERWGLAFADADALFVRVDPSIATVLPRRFVENVQALPLCTQGGKVLLATADPTIDAMAIERALGTHAVDLVVVTPTDLTRLRTAVELGQLQPLEKVPDEQRGTDLLDQQRFSAELVAIFDAMLVDAIAQRASDLHLEIYGEHARVRFRIDGDLHDAPRYQLGKQQLAGIINVLKVSSDLDIAEHRLPQGGRFTARAKGRVFDLRVQTQPSLHGEHAVVRLLPQHEQLLEIADLGFPRELAERYARLLRIPAGLVLVVGPTGSGKSTTLYAALQVLAHDQTRKVITVEDPIEYALDGIQQVAARAELGFGFAQAMRAFVREDPDVILVGEIRDAETALEAIRASQTGHLVLSTLHCNDAVDAVQRLRDLGMHKNSIASELFAVVAQRLAKRICPGCRAEVEPKRELAAEVFPHGIPAGFRFYAGKGCGRCGGLGALGRIAVVEFLPTGPEMRRAIARDIPLDDLRAEALRSGLVPMREHALALVDEGVIAFDELPWLLPPERLAPDDG